MKTKEKRFLLFQICFFIKIIFFLQIFFKLVKNDAVSGMRMGTGDIEPHIPISSALTNFSLSTNHGTSS
jgi:hypothetical protein